jgi:hypothetical protein
MTFILVLGGAGVSGAQCGSGQIGLNRIMADQIGCSS